MILVVILTAFTTLLSVTLIDVVRAESDRGAHANWSATAFQAAEAGLDDYRRQARRRPRLLPPLRPSGRVDAPAHVGRGRRARPTATTTRRTPRPALDRGRLARRHRPGRTRAARTTGASCRTATSTTCRSTRPALRRHPVNPTTSCGSSRPAGARHVHAGHAGDRDVRAPVEPDRLLPVLGRRRQHRRRDVREDLLERRRQPHGHARTQDIFAEGSITGSPTMVDGAQKYAERRLPAPARSRTTRSTSPSSSSRSSTSSGRPRPAASTSNQAGKTGLENRLQLERHLHVRTVHRLEPRGSSPAPTCSPTSATDAGADERRHLHRRDGDRVGPRQRPASRSAPAQNIIVAGNIAPVTGGDDVIGLVAYSDLWVAAYAPDQLTWTAAVLVADEHLALGGTAATGAGSGCTFTGSAATKTGGYFGEYQTPRLRLRPDPPVPAAALVPRGRRRVHGDVLPRSQRRRPRRAPGGTPRSTAAPGCRYQSVNVALAALVAAARSRVRQLRQRRRGAGAAPALDLQAALVLHRVRDADRVAATTSRSSRTPCCTGAAGTARRASRRSTRRSRRSRRCSSQPACSSSARPPTRRSRPSS